jgi:hypothetical protein
MNRLYIMLAMLLLTNVASAQHDSITAEDKAYTAIEAIPEIQQLIKNDTGKVWQLMMRTTRTPSANFKYYWIQVGQTNKERFYTQFNFYVDPKDFEVYLLDTKTDSIFTVPQWRLRHP